MYTYIYISIYLYISVGAYDQRYKLYKFIYFYDFSFAKIISPAYKQQLDCRTFEKIKNTND